MSSEQPDQPKDANAKPQRGARFSRAQALFHRALGRASPTASAEFGDSEVGRLLCATRMRLGKDLQEIAKILHIRYNYLVAIEDGRYEDLPGQAYAIGFVRAYADHLDLDGAEIVRRYKEDSTGLKRKAALEFTIPTPDSGIPSGIALLSAVLLGMSVYGIWYGLSGTGRQLAPAVQEVPVRLLPPTEQPTPPEGAPAEGDATAPAAEGSVAPAESGSPDAAGPATEATPPGPASGAPPGPVPGGQPGSPVPPAAPKAGTPTAPAAAAGPAAPALPPQPSGDVIEVRAKADSWIQVREGETIILTRLLHKGESYQAPDKPNITLMTANAGGIEIILNGQVLPPLGETGTVASGIVLDANHLQGGD